MKPSGGAKTESWFAPLKKGFQNMHQWAPKQNSNRILPRKAQTVQFKFLVGSRIQL